MLAVRDLSDLKHLGIALSFKSLQSSPARFLNITYTCTYVCMYVCMYVCVYICMYLHELRRNKDIVIKQAGKGRAVVIMNTQYYRKRLQKC